jgi:CTP synthase
MMCDVDQEGVVAAVDAPSIYDIPRVLHREGLDAFVIRRLGLPFRDVNWKSWDALLERVHKPAHEVTVGLVGKYIDLPDAYLSVSEALRAGGFANNARVTIKWVASDDCETPEGAAKVLKDVDAVLVPGGFGVRGIEGKLGALTYTRKNKIPTLGICLGLQCMVIEFAREVASMPGASSLEFDADTAYPVIATMADQVDIPAHLKANSIVHEVYGASVINERHRHRYEVNNEYRDKLSEQGLIFSGLSPDGKLVEFIELDKKDHPYYVATQAHPEFKSRPTKAHPLFEGLVKAVLNSR